MASETKREIRSLLCGLERMCEILARDIDRVIAGEVALHNALNKRIDANCAVDAAALTDGEVDMDGLKQAAACAVDDCESANINVRAARWALLVDTSRWFNALVNLQRAELDARRKQEQAVIGEWERFNKGHRPLLEEIDSVRARLGNDQLFICDTPFEKFTRSGTAELQDLKAHLADAVEELYEA